MLDEQRRRVEKAVTDLINDLYKSHLRKMQSDMHSCAVRCCDDIRKQPRMDNVQSCIDECATPLLKAQDYMQHELGQFQVRLQRCVMVSVYALQGLTIILSCYSIYALSLYSQQCNEDVRSLIPNNTNEADMARFRNQFERCTIQCVDKHIDLIPNMMRAMKSVLSSGPNAMRQA
ncbi:protein FAM136A-like isoform 1-T1 [Glossina fuscipes fuscipes]